MEDNEYGYLVIKIDEILKEQGISKTKICKDLELSRTNFNRYCNNKMKRLDVDWLCRMCAYLGVELGELIQYKSPKQKE